MQLVEAIVADRWRLDRATCLEASLFCEGAERFADSPDATGDPELDLALSEGRVWTAEAKNLNLLSLYESRIHRRFEKNLAMLRKLQADRKTALQQAIYEAALLAQLAEAKGEAYKMAEAFERRNFVFSSAEIAQMVTRHRRLEEAKSCPTPRASRSAQPPDFVGRASGRSSAQSAQLFRQLHLEDSHQAEMSVRGLFFCFCFWAFAVRPRRKKASGR